MASLLETDIVITSHKIVEIEYRKATAGAKVVCRVCSRKFYPEKLRVRRRGGARIRWRQMSSLDQRGHLVFFFVDLYLMCVPMCDISILLLLCQDTNPALRTPTQTANNIL